MAYHIQRVDYFYTIVNDQPGEAYQVLSQLAGLGVNLLAFHGVPMGPMRTQLILFPEETPKMTMAARKAGWRLDGPHHAMLVQGDDKLGALADIHQRVNEANVHISASTGVADGRGGFGCILYLRPEEFERAASALGL